MDAEFLTSREVATLLRIHPKTLSRLRTERRGPPWHQPEAGKILYRRSDIEAYLDAHRHEPAGEPA